MAEPRKVPFVTLSAFAAGPASEPRKCRHEDEAGINLEESTAVGTTPTGVGDGGLFGKASDGDNGEPRGITVRLNLCLSEPSDQASAEFNYSELVQSIQVKKAPPQALTPACDPNDPFADEERERQEVEALAKKFESKYGNSGKKKRKDRMQDLIDIGFGYDESDPFIDNSEAVFLLIQSEKIKNDYVYLSWLARCYIMNKKARLAWELYLKMETSAESFSLLQLIANDCYKMGQFYYSAKAFDILERLDQNPEYWEGKRGACVGIFQLILAGREPRETLREVLPLLRNTGNPQVEYIIRALKKWAKDNRVSL